MKLYVALGLTALLVGCASGPRPYDGVIGYQVASMGGATQVIYVDEARVQREKTLARISEVCSMQSKASTDGLKVNVTSEEEYLADVSMSVPVTVGSVATGDVRGIGTSGSTTISQSVSQNQALTRQMKVRKIAALCPRAAP